MLTRGFALFASYNTPTNASWYAWKNGSSTVNTPALVSQYNQTRSLRLVPPISSTQNYSYWSFMALGTSDQEPAFEDNFVIEPISTLTLVSGTLVENSAGTKNMLNFSCTVRNDTEAPITVKEIGVGVYHWATGATNTSGIMVARSVLETPVTVGVGETYAFSYSIEVA